MAARVGIMAMRRDISTNRRKMQRQSREHLLQRSEDRGANCKFRTSVPI
jgi:hypothetical protein